MTQITDAGKLQHLLTIDGIDRAHFDRILAYADDFANQHQHEHSVNHDLSDATCALLFFESSTRTRCSFELAAKRLGATVMNCATQDMATSKGETVLDTLHTLQAMGTHYFVIRHQSDDLVMELAQHLQPGSHIINAGAGRVAHPSQALLDLMTIRRCKLNQSNLKIAIVGDIKHSRVVSSQLACFSLYQLGDIVLSGPSSLLPSEVPYDNVRITENIDDALSDADVVIFLRIQLERIPEQERPDKEQYFKEYGLTDARLALAKPDAIVMHPGPVNRDVEIASHLVDGPQSVILQQVNNGVALRMGILKYLHEQ